MFEYFTDKAIKGVILAQEEARRSGYNLVGTEHVLLGIIGEGTALAATTLKQLGVSIDQTRKFLENAKGKQTGQSPANLPFTPKVKRIFEQAFQEARQLGENRISPEHLLLATIQERDNLASKLLIAQKVDLDNLRTEIIKKLGEQPPQAVASRQKRSEFGDSPSSNNTLKEFGTNLTQLAAEGKLDPVVGREKEIERTIQILGRRTKNNPVLVGEPGVGKTAIAEGLAQLIVNNDVPEILKDKQVIALDMGRVLAGTRFRGDFEERIKAIIKEVQEAQNIILFIDEIHNLVGAGALGGTMDAANMLKPALARGVFQCLGATTVNEYRQYIEKDAALERRFQMVKVGEPSVEETIEILQGLRKNYEDFHKVKFTDEALVAAAKLSDRYISDRFLPDKAIDLIDEAGSRTHINYSLKNKAQKQETVINPESLLPVVDEAQIGEIVAFWTGVPVSKVNESETETLLNLESLLHERVVGQNQAVEAVSRAIRRSRVGLKNPNRPIASLIFSGPTGVGKTELAKAIAAAMFGSQEAMIRLDMSELMESHTVSKLIGSPPGYLGYEDGGQLTEAVRRKPYSVVLFDEIEKAHPDVFNLLLQVLDDGHLSDAKGRKVDFKNTLIIMTSNIGSKVIEKGGGGIGFDFADHQNEVQYNRIRNLVNDELKQYFRPEFLNRLDEIIVFRQLNQTEIKDIADILIQQVADNIKELQNINLVVTDAFKQRVVKEGYDPRYGARPLRRAIMRLLEDPLAEGILSGELQEGDNALVDLDEQSQVVATKASLPEFAPVSVG